MRSLGLNGVILHNETSISLDTGYIATNHFETIIAFEALVKDGMIWTQKLVARIKDLCFPSNPPSMNYTYVYDSLAVKPTVSGVVITETNVQSQNHRYNSSGKVYNLSNPSLIPRRR